MIFNELNNYYEFAKSMKKKDSLLPQLIYMGAYNMLSYYQGTDEYNDNVSATTALFNDLISSIKANATYNGWLSDDGINALTNKANMVTHAFYGEYNGHNSDFSSYITNDFNDDLCSDYGKYYHNLANIQVSWAYKTSTGEMTFQEENQLNMEPFTPNAFYSPLANSINITMGYLFSKTRDISTLTNEQLLGEFGLVLGHEITHGFDSTGCYFDGEGNYVSRSIFPQVDLKAFVDKQQEVIKLYDYEIMPGLYQSGATTLSEDLADIGGLGLCFGIIRMKNLDFDYEAFYKDLGANFMSKSTRKVYLNKLQEDVHAFGGARLNPLMKSRGKFMEVFNVQEWDEMYRDPAKEIIIW